MPTYVRQGCPYCAGKVRKKPKDYKALAKERGFKWRGPEVKSGREKTFWECPQGHRWEAPYSSIQQGSGYPHCYGNVPKTDQDYLGIGRISGILLARSQCA